MNRYRILLLSGLLLFLCSATSAMAQTSAVMNLEPKVVETVEAYLRRDAVKIATPDYSADALAAGAHGLVIVAVRFDENFDPIKISILQSAHPSITEAVIKAVKEWKIGKQPRIDYGRPQHLQGELRFHFIIENGQGRVADPSLEEMEKWSKPYLESVNKRRKRNLDWPFGP